MIRTGRAPTASVVSRAAKSSGSSFSKPPESADHSWDDACPELPSAIHDAPATGRRPRLPPSAPSAQPAPPESATKPTLHRPELVLPKAAGTPPLPLRSSVCVAVRPNAGGRGRPRFVGGTRPEAGRRLLVPPPPSSPSV